MTDIRDNAIHCEAKKHAYRQTQDGVVVSFVLHPQEVPEGLATAPLGARYMLAMVELGDDEKPKGQNPIVQRAAIMCNDEEFWKFVEHAYPLDWQQYDGGPAKIAAAIMRQVLGIESRSELATNSTACVAFEGLSSRFAQWRQGQQ